MRMSFVIDVTVADKQATPFLRNSTMVPQLTAPENKEYMMEMTDASDSTDLPEEVKLAMEV